MLPRPLVLPLIASLVLALAACPQTQPYFIVKKPAAVASELMAVAIDVRGIQLLLRSDCRREIVEHWCPLSNPQCGPRPEVVRYGPAICFPGTLEQQPASGRAPWGKVYQG